MNWLMFTGMIVIGTVLLRGPIRQIRLGMHLTKMTSVMEKIELSRYTLPVGMGGGVDSLSVPEQYEANKIFDSGVSFLRKFPKHEVTKALIKNAIVADKLDRPIRYVAINNLIGNLVDGGVAISIEDFMNIN
ncbi:hypothetical protein sphantq_00172 [Sphingobium sp. AntQ-1]|uniref:hypothetical protein n=1 Tax=Sphingobium sp. AntQ-1 TaxID=2930091 RepID=UPI00234F0180|nr:hypothetical protein [Sphingobium sp. AntQ-1]WCP11787.1 hypothetical protein sphantq_00172 [Sphingobium sp. AntQ-1]